MAYDENLAFVLEAIDNCECPCLNVRGVHFDPDEERDQIRLGWLAHHFETRKEIQALRDMLNDALENSKPTVLKTTGRVYVEAAK